MVRSLRLGSSSTSYSPLTRPSTTLHPLSHPPAPPRPSSKLAAATSDATTHAPACLAQLRHVVGVCGYALYSPNDFTTHGQFLELLDLSPSNLIIPVTCFAQFRTVVFLPNPGCTDIVTAFQFFGQYYTCTKQTLPILVQEWHLGPSFPSNANQQANSRPIYA